MQLDQLIKALRQVGMNYPKDKFFRNNQEAAEKLKKLCLETTGKSINEEVLQQKVLSDLSVIFANVESSTVLLKEVKEKLLAYDPFKGLSDYLPKNGQATPQQMSVALERLAKRLDVDYQVRCNLAIAKADTGKAEMKPSM